MGLRDSAACTCGAPKHFLEHILHQLEQCENGNLDISVGGPRRGAKDIKTAT
uniref:Uncharacterized protein n=1 Tax=Arion vulgaris TaxID=1028688 RepID=A0A0B7BPF5_9EUPU